ncbi:MAG: thioredoxin [Syntrophaceae bacterium]|nr:thioredoxin [Syntrophaceae bacterium]
MEKHTVAVAFDGSRTSAGALAEALAKGGYPPEGPPRPLASMPAAPERPLVGKVAQGSLFRDYPSFLSPYRDYTPRKDAVDKIAAVRGSYDLLVFFGTWSPDSLREVPRLLRALDAAGNKDLRLALYGVDRDKREGLGMSEKFGVRSVPTVVVLRDGIERGRIVERPRRSMEEDLLEILMKD